MCAHTEYSSIVSVTVWRLCDNSIRSKDVLKHVMKIIRNKKLRNSYAWIETRANICAAACTCPVESCSMPRSPQTAKTTSTQSLGADRLTLTWSTDSSWIWFKVVQAPSSRKLCRRLEQDSFEPVDQLKVLTKCPKNERTRDNRGQIRSSSSWNATIDSEFEQEEWRESQPSQKTNQFYGGFKTIHYVITHDMFLQKNHR